MQRFRSHLSFANVISMIALFVALGGASYAAVSLPKNSVGPKQIKKRAVRAKHINKNSINASKLQRNSVNGAKVLDGSLGSADILDNSVGGADIADNGVGGANLADNSVSAGEVSDDSLTAADIAGNTLEPEVEPDLFARVQADGTLLPAVGDFPATSKGITNDNITHPNPGVYCIGGLPKQPRSAMIASDNAAFSATADNAFVVSVALERGNNILPCAGGNARIRTTKVDPALANATDLDHPFIIWMEY